MDRGFLAEVIPIALSLFLFAFIFIIFYALLSYSGEQQTTLLTSASSKTSSMNELLSLLQTPILLNDETVPLADAMVMAIERPEYQLRVHDEITQHMFLFHAPTKKTLCGYVLILRNGNKEVLSAHSIQFATTAYVYETYPFTLSSYKSPGTIYNADFSVECSAY